VPDDVKEDRRARFMARQAAISAAKLAARVGTTQHVLVDGRVEARRGRRKLVVAHARSIADAPEIDGRVTIEDGASLTAGQFAKVTIVAADAHDLTARIAG
jgi:ribosomal protein S12 methylthiotransferase